MILLGGILSGWFTPTEAGVIAVTYILVIVIPLLNRGHLRELWRDFVHAGLIYSLPMITIAARLGVRLDPRLSCAARSWSRAGSRASPATTRT